MNLAQAYAVIAMDDSADATPPCVVDHEGAWETMVAEANALITADCEARFEAATKAEMARGTILTFIDARAIVKRSEGESTAAWLCLVAEARRRLAFVGHPVPDKYTPTGPSEVIVEDEETP